MEREFSEWRFRLERMITGHDQQRARATGAYDISVGHAVPEPGVGGGPSGAAASAAAAAAAEIPVDAFTAAMQATDVPPTVLINIQGQYTACDVSKPIVNGLRIHSAATFPGTDTMLLLTLDNIRAYMG